MNKVYLSGNYIIVDEDGILISYPRNHSEYDENIDNFILRKYPNISITEFKFNEIGMWFDEAGTTVWTIEGLRTFLRTNTGFNTAPGGSGVDISQNVNQYSSLISGVVPGELAYVKTSQGTNWLPGTIGGTYYPAGFYTWSGSEWVSDRNAIAEQLELNTLEIQNKSDIGHVHTHGDINNQTFEQFLSYVKSLDPNPVLIYLDDLLVQIVYDWNSNQTFLSLLYDTDDTLISLTLSGIVGAGINKVKTLNYDIDGNLIGITYSLI